MNAKDVRDFLAECHANVEVGGWVPVSDHLPEPGKMILACYKNRVGNWRIICGYWIPEKFSESDPDSEIGEYDEASDTYYDPAGWYECIDNWDEYRSIMVDEEKISHWMPLPAPPNTGAS